MGARTREAGTVRSPSVLLFTYITMHAPKTCLRVPAICQQSIDSGCAGRVLLPDTDRVARTKCLRACARSDVRTRASPVNLRFSATLPVSNRHARPIRRRARQERPPRAERARVCLRRRVEPRRALLADGARERGGARELDVVFRRRERERLRAWARWCGGVEDVVVLAAVVVALLVDSGCADRQVVEGWGWDPPG